MIEIVERVDGREPFVVRDVSVPEEGLEADAFHGQLLDRERNLAQELPLERADIAAEAGGDGEDEPEPENGDGAADAHQGRLELLREEKGRGQMKQFLY